MSELPELRNPFQGGLIVGHGAGMATTYHTEQPVPRGDPRFVLSRGELLDFAFCPSRWVRGWQGKNTEATEWGSLMDCLVLTPEEFDQRFVVAPETYPAGKTHPKVRRGEVEVGGPLPWNWNASFCKAWKEDNEGDRTIVSAEDKAQADAAVARLMEDADIAGLLACSQKQVYVRTEYHDPETRLVVPIKVLIDLVPEAGTEFFGACLGDFKTALCGEPRQWERVIEQRGYHIQAAFYLDAWNAATGENRTDFLHAISENTHPWETGKRDVSTDYRTLGRMAYMDALRWYAACLAGKPEALGEVVHRDAEVAARKREEMIAFAGIAPEEAKEPKPIWPRYDDRVVTGPVLRGWQVSNPPAYLLNRP